MNSDCDDPHSITSDTVSSEIETVSDDILDNNGDEAVDCIEQDPAKRQLLSRLSQESQEDGAAAVSTRINFGIQEYKEPETHITIENSMRRVLNLGNENEKKKRRKPTKPTIDKGYAGMENTRRAEPREGNRNKKPVKNDLIENVRKPFSDINLENEKIFEKNHSGVGIKLNNLTQHNVPEKWDQTLKTLPQNNFSGSGLTLNSLAQQHLNTSSQGAASKPNLNLSNISLAGPKPSSGLSLSSLAQNHLSGNTSSSLGTNLSSLSQNHLAGNTSNSGLSLSSLAQNHLAGNNSSTGPSLSSLAQNHLAGNTSGISLNSLATQHTLSTNGLSGLSGLNNGLSTSRSGLSGLAKIHLQDQGSTAVSKSSGFNIPSLFGSSTSASTISPPKLPSASSTTPPKLPTISPPLRAKTPEADIDLSSALRSSQSPISLYTSPEQASATSSSDRTDILVQDFNIPRRCDIRKRKSSPLGAVVVRKWLRCGGGEAVVVVVPPRELLDVEEFRFDVPSPDEAIIFAQAKAFNRPSLASRVISRPTAAVRVE